LREGIAPVELSFHSLALMPGFFVFGQNIICQEQPTLWINETRHWIIDRWESLISDYLHFPEGTGKTTEQRDAFGWPTKNRLQPF
jgi:hypothetical protein